mmetsp:Transcript_67365/g.213237  ORF Transcript_67365/g.213237 Transcript_67365/m.213237 type:complete len:173 (-) Transcript_67365:120-638(-)
MRYHWWTLYHHVLRWRMFSAVSDPAEAMVMGVPFLNIRLAWLPWLRVRLCLQRHRAIEVVWIESFLNHLTVAAALLFSFASASVGLAVVGGGPTLRFLSAAAPWALGCACVMAGYVFAAVSLASRITSLHDDDIAMVQEERCDFSCLNPTCHTAFQGWSISDDDVMDTGEGG